MTILGVVKREAVDRAAVQKRTHKAVFYIHVEARTVVNTKQPLGGVRSGPAANAEYDGIVVLCLFALVDARAAPTLMAIQKVAQSASVFRDLVNSLCPSIYGYYVMVCEFSELANRGAQA